jgi:predicted NAD/FAD-binding protein
LRDFDSKKMKIAIVGAGISGLGCAYLLSKQNEVKLFEASTKLGGHARTILAGKNSDTAVDTGFIVFNYENYPHLTKMFEELDVPVKKSDMSFAASIGNGAIEYGMSSLNMMAAQRRNVIRPKFWNMMRDIMRFNETALDLSRDPDTPLDEFLDSMRMGEWFRNYYFLPISGAIWSSSPEQMKRFPAKSLVQFFDNHSLLSWNTNQWYTVDGGSEQYVSRMAAAIDRYGGTIRVKSKVSGVRRVNGKALVKTENGDWEEFDQVIFACHSDQVLPILADATAAENLIIGSIKYQKNKAVMHTDINQMPKRKRAWASWVYKSKAMQPDPKVGITYWMNSLQSLPTEEQIFVSLNPSPDINEDLIYDEKIFEHPIFDRQAFEAQEKLKSIQGQNSTYYCGAWTRYGFHEDGYLSAVRIAEKIIAIDKKLAA